VSELDKRRLFIYSPWNKYGLLTLFTYTRTGLFAYNVFSFYALSYSDTSQEVEAALGHLRHIIPAREDEHHHTDW
jgi:hypothetical protein